MFRLFISLLIAVFILASSACDSGAPQSGRTLIVDLVAVARALGRDEVMTQKIEQARQLLSEQLVKISSDLEKQLKEKETELDESAENTNEDTSKQLQQLTQQANIQLKKTQQLANQKAVAYRDNLVSNFRNEVMTVAESIAHEHRAVAVYVAGSNLLWYSSSIDITDEVIGLMRAQAKEVNEQDKGTEGAAEIKREQPAVTE